VGGPPGHLFGLQAMEAALATIFIFCHTIIYSCLCGSLQESVQEGKGEIRYHFRQHGCYACQSLGNLVIIVIFQSC
jgi:hypothetical protein